MIRASLLVVLVACADEPTVDGLAIVGSYTTSFGSTYEITETELTVQYSTPDVYTITAFDNDERTIVAENAAANSYFAGMWSRFDWASVAEELYVCQQVFDGQSESEAAEAPLADASDPAAGGCGAKDFAFTLLTPVP